MSKRSKENGDQKMRRLQILSEYDAKVLYGRPVFTDVERRHFFSLPDNLTVRLNIRRKNPRRAASFVFFILQYGYFKAKHQFFMFSFGEVHEDANFIMKHFLPNDDFPKELPIRKTQRKIKNIILEYFDFSDNSNQACKKVNEKLEELVRRTHQPIETFNELRRC